MNITKQHIENYIKMALTEDLGEAGDITSQYTVPATKKIKAHMNARTQGVICGLEITKQVFQFIQPDAHIELGIEDGESIKKNQSLMSILMYGRNLLSAERTALNILSHLSGIATLTNQYVKAIEGTSAKITDTRKTIAGLRAFEKYAVRCGGGHNHRFGLYDAILIKDNHIALAGGVEKALQSAYEKKAHLHKIEIEVDNFEQFKQVFATNIPDLILLDNMQPEQLKKIVEYNNGKYLLEASGGITLENIREIAETNVDYIAIGAITHSAPSLDIGLDIKEI